MIQKFVEFFHLHALCIGGLLHEEKRILLFEAVATIAETISNPSTSSKLSENFTE